MRSSLRIATAFALSALFAATAVHAAPATPDSLKTILNHVQSAGKHEHELFARHRAAFVAASPEKRQAMMKQVQARLDKAKAAASQASDTFSANELKSRNWLVN